MLGTMTQGECQEHVDLMVENEGKPCGVQPVPAKKIAADLYELTFTPGMVDGVAAGDTVRVIDARTGRFEIVARGGNLAIKVFSKSAAAPLVTWLIPRLTALGGVLDGQIDSAAVWTVPLEATFEALEALLGEACRAHPGATWYFANVYGDNGEPLNWWL
jgi:hypothetical protein